MLTTYNAVLALHLVAVVFVVGPLALAGVLAPRALDDGAAGVPALRAAARTTRLYGIVSIVVPLLGSAMVRLGDQGKPWAFNQFWISASWALYVVAVVATLAVAAPAIAKAATAVEAGESAAVLKGRIQAAAGGAALAWLVIILLMVFKPGAPGG